MRIKLPTIQQVAANFYEVKKAACLGDACEVCDKCEKVIWWEADVPNERDRLIRYAHGLIHAIEQEYGVGPLKDDANDSDVDRLAHGFVQGWLALVEAA